MHRLPRVVLAIICSVTVLPRSGGAETAGSGPGDYGSARSALRQKYTAGSTKARPM